MTANVEAMIRAGVEAYRAGNRIEARALLERAIEIDDYNEDAWLWLSAVVETKDEQRTCLENVLVINPGNERAQAGLKALGPAAPATPAEPDSPFSAADNETPFSDFNFDDEDDPFDVSPASTQQPEQPSTPAASTETEDEADGEWGSGIATSSASSTYKGPQLTSDDYDSWMSNLNIGSKSKTTPEAESNIFKEEEDPFDLFSDTDFSGSESSGGFNTFDFDEPDDPPAVPASAIRPPTTGFDDGFSDDFDDFVEDYESGSQASSFFDETELTDLSRNDTLASLSDPSSADFLFSDDEGGDTEPDPQELFSLIPPSVKSTRLPGTVESVSGGVKIGVFLLILLNVGAVAAIVMQFIG
jgi:hypothetical protein